MKPMTIDGVDIELDDDIDPADLGKGLEPRQRGEVDLIVLGAAALADAHLEDDDAPPYSEDLDDADLPTKRDRLSDDGGAA